MFLQLDFEILNKYNKIKSNQNFLLDSGEAIYSKKPSKRIQSKGWIYP